MNSTARGEQPGPAALHAALAPAHPATGNDPGEAVLLREGGRFAFR
jgi:hypothetical protein